MVFFFRGGEYSQTSHLLRALIANELESEYSIVPDEFVIVSVVSDKGSNYSKAALELGGGGEEATKGSIRYPSIDMRRCAHLVFCSCVAHALNNCVGQAMKNHSHWFDRCHELQKAIRANRQAMERLRTMQLRDGAAGRVQAPALPCTTRWNGDLNTMESAVSLNRYYTELARNRMFFNFLCYIY